MVSPQEGEWRWINGMKCLTKLVWGEWSLAYCVGICVAAGENLLQTQAGSLMRNGRMWRNVGVETPKCSFATSIASLHVYYVYHDLSSIVSYCLSSLGCFATGCQSVHRSIRSPPEAQIFPDLPRFSAAFTRSAAWRTVFAARLRSPGGACAPCAYAGDQTSLLTCLTQSGWRSFTKITITNQWCEVMWLMTCSGFW